MAKSSVVERTYYYLTQLISETNGLSLENTIELLLQSPLSEQDKEVQETVDEFMALLSHFQIDQTDIESLLNHPVSESLFLFFKNFPLKYNEEHIHLTGSLNAEFIFPRIKKLLDGPHKEIYQKRITDVYGHDALPINTPEDIDKLIRLRPEDGFDQYLKILLLPKLILIDRQAHEEATYHLASELWHKYNVGSIRLKFTLSRATSDQTEKVPGAEELSPEDVIMGLYSGFQKFKLEHPEFDFILSPCFRKEPSFFDSKAFKSKGEHFNYQVQSMLEVLEKFPELSKHLVEIDTVGSEKDLFRKQHFNEMKIGLRKLQSRGFAVRSHHGETWHTLKKGIQAVDNAMNIWHIDALEHGLSLGINPNFYFHSLFQRIILHNQRGEGIQVGTPEYNELHDMDWLGRVDVLEKILAGEKLNEEELTIFTKTKFHLAREVEGYQHDILNRVIDKQLQLIALPSSNKELTGQFEDYKDHPFSWWEKKGMKLGVGTDNYITLRTNFIREMLILLYTDPTYLKITKLLIVATGESRRPLISQLLWDMRKKVKL